MSNLMVGIISSIATLIFREILISRDKKKQKINIAKLCVKHLEQIKKDLTKDKDERIENALLQLKLDKQAICDKVEKKGGRDG